MTTFFALIASVSVVAQSSGNSSLLWKISGNGLTKSSYLYGTIHLICPEDFILNPAVESLISESDKLVFEIDMDDPGMMAGMMATMSMKNGQKLSGLLQAPEYDRLSVYLKDSVGVAISMFETVKPFVVNSLLYTRILSCQPMSYEQKFVELAARKGKEIVGLETVQDQMSIFDTIPYTEQARVLINTVDSMNIARAEFRKMVQIYKSQDIEQIDRVTAESGFSYSGMQKVMLFNRNRNWIVKLKSMLPEEALFIAVGAAHLGGKQGVVNLLRDAGYQVEAVN